jgi:hypothetical protein
VSHVVVVIRGVVVLRAGLASPAEAARDSIE